jgi:hypothetical protein
VTLDGSAQGVLAFVDGGFHEYGKGVTSWTASDLDHAPAVSPPGTVDATFPRAMNLQHVASELTAHGAEASLLRHLWALSHGGVDPVPWSG